MTSATDIVRVLNEEKLSWNIRESSSDVEGQITHILENEAKNKMGHISIYSLDESIALQLVFFPKEIQTVVNTVESVGENDWENILKVAGKLYGESKFHKNIQSELEKYVSDRDSKIHGHGALIKRLDDIHVQILLRASIESEYGYDLESIIMMNSSAYEKSQSVNSRIWKDELIENGINIIEGIPVSDLTESSHGDVNTLQALIIQGYLDNIAEVKIEDLPSAVVPELTKSSYVGTSLYVRDYFKATLKDETGSVEVIGLNNSFTDDELKQVRNHHLMYIPSEDVYIIRCSTSEKETYE